MKQVIEGKIIRDKKGRIEKIEGNLPDTQILTVFLDDVSRSIDRFNEASYRFQLLLTAFTIILIILSFALLLNTAT